jgi:hypothetical protein
MTGTNAAQTTSAIQRAATALRVRGLAFTTRRFYDSSSSVALAA